MKSVWTEAWSNLNIVENRLVTFCTAGVFRGWIETITTSLLLVTDKGWILHNRQRITSTLLNHRRCCCVCVSFASTWAKCTWAKNTEKGLSFCILHFNMLTVTAGLSMLKLSSCVFKFVFSLKQCLYILIHFHNNVKNIFVKINWSTCLDLSNLYF